MSKRLMGMGVLVGFLFSILLGHRGLCAQQGNGRLRSSYGKVTFTHKKHADTLKIDCLKCHHTWKKGETTGSMCKDCHKEKAEGKTSLAERMPSQGLSRVATTRPRRPSKPAGPTVCTQCHVKAAKK